MGSPGSQFPRFGGNTVRKRFSSVHWGPLAFVAGAHAAGLLALSGLGGPAPAQVPPSARATLSVRLIAPPAPVMPTAVMPPSVMPAPVAAPPAKVTPRSPIAKSAIRSTPGTPSPKATPPRPTTEIVPPAEASPRHDDVPPDNPPQPVADAASSLSPSGSAAAPAPPSSATTPPAPQATAVALIPASFDAAYLHNPAPIYPRSSRRRGDEGKVVLRVHVLGDGSADAVEVAESSGHSRLDDAAREAVRNWRFTPAHRGEVRVDSWLRVPIVFRLDD